MSSPIEQAGDLSKLETQQFMKDLAQRVRWCDHDDIPIERFHKLFLLVVFDLWTDLDPEELAEKVSVPEKQLDLWRMDPDYQAVKSNVEREFEVLKSPRSFKEHIRDPLNQDRLARSGLRTALYAKNPRDRNKALETMADRAMPRPSDKQGDRVLVLSEGAAKLMLEAERESEKLVKEVERIEGDVGKAGA